jgi:glycosyltransferase involved in cell wall biosynthesis
MTQMLTVIIPCKNEEANIRLCIESVLGIADEIIVADSGSTDRTMEIAEEFNCRIIEREYVYSADFKNWAIPLAKNEWILIVDADERVTPELAEEIKRELQGDPRNDGYTIFRRNYLFGHVVKRSGWGTDNVLRLFKRDISRYKDMRVHSEIVIETGRVGKLKGKLDHFSYWNFGQIVKKHDMYATWAAEDLRDKGIKSSFLHLTFLPFWRFFRQYVIQRGFLDGIPGLIVCTISMYYVFLKYAKLWVMQHGLEQPNPEKDRKTG